ncbi:hypothetical protein SNEBB_008121 [Seison nebaliae]|nr:hypothetical protein SNEBB_008121 [Seison nebaliae]
MEEFKLYSDSEELYTKLRLLSYEKSYVSQWKQKPISKYYFTVRSNSGEQFSSFTALSVWLIIQLGEEMEKPQEYDDPNAIIAKIVEYLRKIEITLPFGQQKLKTGSGEEVIFVLLTLATKVLEKIDFKIGEPVYDETVADIDEGDKETIATDADKEFEDVLEENNVEMFEMEQESVPNFATISPALGVTPATKPEAILTSTTNETDWMLEVERVLPKLKVIIENKQYDWRYHLEKLKNLSDSINKSLPEPKIYLDTLKHEIDKAFQKMSSREKYLNTHVEDQLNMFKSLKETLSELKENYKVRGVGIEERSQKLNLINDDLDQLKEELEEVGQNIIDGLPVVKIKKTLEELRNETGEMDLRIGVLEHELSKKKRQRIEENLY